MAINKEGLSETIREKQWLEDMDNLTAEDVIDSLINSIDSDITVDMIRENLKEAKCRLRDHRLDRVNELLGIKYSFEMETNQNPPVEGKTMTEVTIPDMHIQSIEKHIQDDYVKRVFGYTSVEDFVVSSIEGCLEADKDIARIRD